MTIFEDRKEYLRLLNESPKEQKVQSFLENHTRFIPRAFVQNHGIHLSLSLRKLAFGADYKTDFFYFSKSSDDWNAVFIELEKPASKFFRRNSHTFHSDFTRALEQINQWRAWFRSDQNKGTFLSMVRAIHVPAHMASNPTFNKYVLVFGRRSEYERNRERRQLIGAQETDNFKIITFDNLAESLSSKHELSIGVRHNHYIDILADEITDPGLYGCVEPTQLRVGKLLHDKINYGPRSNEYVMDNGKSIEVLTRAAPLVQVRSDADAENA